MRSLKFLQISFKISYSLYYYIYKQINNTMRTIYVAYRITNKKTNQATYGITSYVSDFVLPFNNQECQKMLLKSMNKKSMQTKEHCIEFLYQNIEPTECKRYFELVYGIKLN